jgi:hypothetical protein
MVALLCVFQGAEGRAPVEKKRTLLSGSKDERLAFFLFFLSFSPRRRGCKEG